ncbi:MAG TPA: hypothetical protein VE130_11635 [Nitrososphaeraceae archaeon]|nr:hypothetical protein [Nitrososphaeraceae archaeon]
MFGVVVALASILVVTTLFQHVIASENWHGTGDIDVLEDAQTGNMTITNQTINGNNTEVEFLSIQSAQSGSITQINATTYTLELNNIVNRTILFSDRPERIVTTVSTSDFVGNWSTGQNSFSADEPNDALIVENNQTGKLETAIVESFNPVYDTTTNKLTYTIMAENATSMNLPSEFGQSVLVIDDTIQYTLKRDSNICC